MHRYLFSYPLPSSKPAPNHHTHPHPQSKRPTEQKSNKPQSAKSPKSRNGTKHISHHLPRRHEGSVHPRRKIVDPALDPCTVLIYPPLAISFTEGNTVIHTVKGMTPNKMIPIFILGNEADITSRRSKERLGRYCTRYVKET